MALEYERDTVSASIELMKFETRHVPGSLKLSQEMAWPYRREDWEFAATVGQGLVLERAGEVIGTAMWWNYGQAHASAGMIIVTASVQGGGYGSRLFNGVLEATDGRNVLLNSTEEGLALYERRGFTAWGTVLQHQGWLTAAATADARDGIRPATVSDLAAIQAFDERATGMPAAVDGGGACRAGRGVGPRPRGAGRGLRHSPEMGPRLRDRPGCSRKRPGREAADPGPAFQASRAVRAHRRLCRARIGRLAGGLRPRAGRWCDRHGQGAATRRGRAGPHVCPGKPVVRLRSKEMGKMETDVKVREAASTIDALITPSLLLDRGRLERNIQRLAERAGKLGVVLRPHMKTAKSIDVARHVFPRDPGPITVSTIAEAEYFAGHGFRDMTYAVGMSRASAIRAMELCRRTGVDLKLLLDTVEQADALADVREATGVTPSVFIELDCDDHRGGLKPDDPKLLEVADRVVAAGANLVGVLAHAGESYGLSTPDALVEAAENERSATVRAAEILRAHGHACPIVSLGSTPTAHFAASLEGVTELRAGVYMFFDLVQHGVGVCAIDDIAVSVLATVIGAKPEKGWVLVDAGWMALSRDRGTASQKLDQVYGVVCDERGGCSKM